MTSMPSPLRVRNAIALLAALAATLAVSPHLHADDAPAAAPAPAETPALRFARHDVARWTARSQALTEAATAAAANLDAANKAVAEAKAGQAAADMALANAVQAIAAAEQQKIVAANAASQAIDALKKLETEKTSEAATIAAARTAVDAAAKVLEAAIQAIPDSRTKQKQAELAKAEADKRPAVAEAAVKPATDAKAAADKALADLQPLLKQAQDRLASFEKAAPQPDPAATRLAQTFTHDRAVLACRFDTTGDHLFAGAEDACFHRWDLFTSAAVHPKVHKSWLGSLALVPPAGSQVITAGHEGKLTWWNGLEADPRALRTIDAHKGYIRAVAVSPDAQFVATAGNDHAVRIWSAADGTLVKELAGHTRHVYNVAFHPSGKFLVSGDLLGIIKQWEVGTWNHVRDLDAKVLWKYDEGFKADVGGVRTFAFSSDGKHMAAGGITDVTNAFAGVGVPCVVLFDWESGKQLKVMKPKDAFQGSIYGVRFSPAGDFIVGAGGGGAGALWFWKLDDDKSFQAIGLPSVAYDLDLHPDGLRLAVALFDKTVRIYDMSPKFEAPPAAAAAK